MEIAKETSMEQIEQFIAESQPVLIAMLSNIAVAALLFFVGRFLSGWLRSVVEKLMVAREIEATLVGFVSNLLYYAAMILTVIITLSQLGIETTSFAAMIAAAGLAIGLALQGSLSNFAAGLLIVMFRPFSKGNYVEAAGKAGSVESIQIFSTVLKTPDNKVVVLPNAQVMNGPIINFSREPKRRVDLVIGISYGSDLAKAKTIVEQVLSAHELVLQDEDFTIGVAALANSSVDLAIRCWANTPDYWKVYFGLNEAIKLAFDREGIVIPFPQMDVRVKNL
jgi:small conductance mechanosensitive channel